MLNRQQHRAEFFQTISDIASLIAITLTCKDEFAVLIDPGGELLPKALLDTVGKARRFDHRPFQYAFGIHLVDILSAGARGADKRKTKFVLGDTDLGRYSQHREGHLRIEAGNRRGNLGAKSLNVIEPRQVRR